MAGASLSIPEKEICAVKRIAESTLAYSPWAFVDAGKMMRVEYGALCGLEGFLVQAGGNHCLVVSVNLLRRSVGVVIDRASLKPVRITHNRQDAHYDAHYKAVTEGPG